MSHLVNIFAVAAISSTLSAASVAAQEDKRSFSERFSYGGEVVGNFSPVDEGYFNELEYERNLLRLLRFNLALEFEASDRIAFLTEIRSDNFDAPEPYALYIRLRPWLERAFTIQAGRIPPVFGRFARQRYEIDNPLIGTPLLYQYPNTLRPDSATTELSEILQRRGFGVKVVYPIGDQSPHAGLPVMNSLRWDTGVQVRIGDDPVELSVALTQGTISNPRVRDDNSGKQVAARAGFRPAFGWVVGVSGARGDYVADEVGEVAGGSGAQTVFGVDLEFARNHLIVRAESMWSRWDTPTLGTGALTAAGAFVEARYKLSPGLYVAGRVDRLSFEGVATPGGSTTWDSSIWRFELGGGYYINRHLLAKVAFQYNERDAGPLTRRSLPAVQLLFWF